MKRRVNREAAKAIKSGMETRKESDMKVRSMGEGQLNGSTPSIKRSKISCSEYLLYGYDGEKKINYHVVT